MFKRMTRLAKGQRGDGVITGIIWMAVVTIVSGAIAYSMWSSTGNAATTAKGQINTTMTNRTGNTANVGAGSINP